MKRLVLVTFALALVLAAQAACASAPTPVPTLPPPPTLPSRPTLVPQPSASPTVVPPTAAPQPTATKPPPTAAAAQSTQAPTTIASAATLVPATTAAPTAVPPTLVPATPTRAPVSASPTPSLPPGLYVTNLRLDPVNPAHRVNTSMFVSFLNTATGDQNVRWVIYIVRADNPSRSIAQSPVNPVAFPPGASPEQDSRIVFNLGASGQTCDYLTVKVDILDVNNKGIDLPGTDGKPLERPLVICN